MGKQKGKKLTKEERDSEGMRPLRYGLPKPKGGASPSPSEGGDVPSGMRNAVGWGDGRRKKSG